jgi:hypothetical protein
VAAAFRSIKTEDGTASRRRTFMREIKAELKERIILGGYDSHILQKY